MNESVMTRMRDIVVLPFEIRVQPPDVEMKVGQTCRLPFERIKPYLTGQPPLRIQPWRRPDPPPAAT